MMSFRWFCSFGLTALVAVTCSSQGEDPPGQGAADPTPPSSVPALVGETEQGLRIVFQASGEEGWRVQLRAPCEARGPAQAPFRSTRALLVPPHQPIGAPAMLVPGSGSFEKEDQWRQELGDGDYEETRVKLTGELTAAGGQGQVEVSRRQFNGQAGSFADDCSWGPTAWEVSSQELTRVEEVTRLPADSSLEAIVLSQNETSLWGVVSSPLMDAARPGYELVQISTETGQSTTQAVDTDANPGAGFAVIGEFAWVETNGVRTGGGGVTGACGIEKVDTSDGRVVSRIDLCITHLTSGEGALWALELINEWSPETGSSQRSALVRIDPGSGEVRRVLPTRGMGQLLTVGGGSVWLATTEEGLVRVEPETGAVQARFGDVAAHALSIKGEGPLWVLDPEDGLWQIDPEGTPRSLGPAPTADERVHGSSGRWSRSLAANSSGAWLASPADRTVYRLDSAGTVTDVVDVPSPPDNLLATDGWLWIISDWIGRLPV